MSNKYAGVYQAPNGTFYVKTKATTKDGYIVNITKRGFYNKTEAFNYKILECEKVHNSYSFEQNNKAMKFHDFLDLYMKEYSITNAETTSRKMSQTINKYFKANITNRPMNDLKPFVFSDFRAFLSTLNNLTSRYRNGLLGILKRIIDSAIDKCYLDSSLGRLCKVELKPISNDGKSIHNDYWELEEFQAFINSFDDNDKYKLFFKCLFTFGCRIGEFRAIQWKDLNTTNNTIHIYKQISSKTGAGHWVVIPRTKTKKERFTVIPQKLVDELIQFKQSRKYTEDDFLFFGKNPISENAIKVVKRKHCELANVKYIRNHDFRHSNITFMLDNNVDLKVVASQVGHSNVSTTLNTYNHISNKRKDKLKSVLDNLPF